MSGKAINISSKCLYEDHYLHTRHYKSLDHSITTDVCIIGGGFTGLITAYHLIDSHLNVCLVEKENIGSGASGRNSGQIIPGFNQDIRVLAKKYGYDAAQKIFSASINAIEDIKANIKNLSFDVHYKDKLIVPALNDKGHEDQHEYAEFLKNLCGYTIDMRSEEETQNITGSYLYAGSMEDKNTGRFNPRLYVDQLASYCADRGISIFEKTPVYKIEDTNADYISVTTKHGTIKAKKVVMAGDAYQDKLVPQLRKKYIITKTYMIATEPLNQELNEKVLPFNHGGFEWRTLTNYYGKTNDNRLLFGGADCAIKTEEKNIFKVLKNNLITTFPHLDDTTITHFWGGNLAVTSNQTPEVNSIDDKIYYAYGYSGHGVVPTHMAGKILAQQIMNKDAPNVMKDVKPLTIPGSGLFDNSIAKLALQWYKLKESFE